MQKIVVNKGSCLFLLSHKAYKKFLSYEYRAQTGKDIGSRINYIDIDSLMIAKKMSHTKRDNPNLVRVIEEMGEDANAFFTKLKIVEIPDGLKWEIKNVDNTDEVFVEGVEIKRFFKDIKI